MSTIKVAGAFTLRIKVKAPAFLRSKSFICVIYLLINPDVNALFFLMIAGIPNREF